MANSSNSAFPLPINRDTQSYDKNGFTKRQYVAAMAMQGLLANHMITDYLRGNVNLPVPEEISKLAVQCADELLKQL